MRGVQVPAESFSLGRKKKKLARACIAIDVPHGHAAARSRTPAFYDRDTGRTPFCINDGDAVARFALALHVSS